MTDKFQQSLADSRTLLAENRAFHNKQCFKFVIVSTLKLWIKIAVTRILYSRYLIN